MSSTVITRRTTWCSLCIEGDGIVANSNARQQVASAGQPRSDKK
jgi:hypothetical protein